MDTYNTNLASIHDDVEHQLSLNLCVSGFCWIGLNDVANEGDFIYTDDSSFDYQPAIFYPDNWNNEEHCVQIPSNDQQSVTYWRDYNCGTLDTFLCNSPFGYSSYWNSKVDQQWTGSTLTCTPNGPCTIICDKDEACSEAKFICPQDAICEIQCIGFQACYRTNIKGSDAYNMMST